MVLPKLLKLLRVRVWITELLRPSKAHIAFFWAGLIGFLGGISSILFRESIHGVQWLLTRHSGSLVETARQLDWRLRLIVPTVGGLVAGIIIQWGMRLARGQKSTDYMEAIVVGDGVIRARPSLVKSASSLLSIASGGSIGREGPMVQLSSMVASWLGRHTHQSEPRLKLMVACGAAAGIASAYNAPIAGSLFVAEIILGSISMESFGPLIFSSVIAALTVHQLWSAEPIFKTPPFKIVSLWEIIAYLALGLLVGVAAPVFLRVLRKSEDLFSQWIGLTFLRMAVGGLVVGVISLYAPEIWGNGYSVVNSMLHTDWAWNVLLIVFLCKLAATAATVGSGAVGGVFTPTLFMGATLGTLWGCAIHALWPASTATPHAYALVGMGCFLAATTHAPLMAILMLFEMTLNYGIILPLMLGCVTAFYTSHAIEKSSIYAESLKRKIPLKPATPAHAVKVGDLMKTDTQAVSESARFSEIVNYFVRRPQKYLYVTGADQQFRGAVSLHTIKPYLNDLALANLVTAYDLLEDNIPCLTPDMNLGQAVQAFLQHDGERLPVVASLSFRRFLGIISKTDLLLTFSFNNQAAPEAGGKEAARPVESMGT